MEKDQTKSSKKSKKKATSGGGGGGAATGVVSSIGTCPSEAVKAVTTPVTTRGAAAGFIAGDQHYQYLRDIEQLNVLQMLRKHQQNADSPSQSSPVSKGVPKTTPTTASLFYGSGGAEDSDSNDDDDLDDMLFSEKGGVNDDDDASLSAQNGTSVAAAQKEERKLLSGHGDWNRGFHGGNPRNPAPLGTPYNTSTVKASANGGPQGAAPRLRTVSSHCEEVWENPFTPAFLTPINNKNSATVTCKRQIQQHVAHAAPLNPDERELASVLKFAPSPYEAHYGQHRGGAFWTEDMDDTLAEFVEAAVMSQAAGFGVTNTSREDVEDKKKKNSKKKKRKEEDGTSTAANSKQTALISGEVSSVPKPAALKQAVSQTYNSQESWSSVSDTIARTFLVEKLGWKATVREQFRNKSRDGDRAVRKILKSRGSSATDYDVDLEVDNHFVRYVGDAVAPGISGTCCQLRWENVLLPRLRNAIATQLKSSIVTTNSAAATATSPLFPPHWHVDHEAVALTLNGNHIPNALVGAAVHKRWNKMVHVAVSSGGDAAGPSATSVNNGSSSNVAMIPQHELDILLTVFRNTAGSFISRGFFEFAAENVPQLRHRSAFELACAFQQRLNPFTVLSTPSQNVDKFIAAYDERNLKLLHDSLIQHVMKSDEDATAAQAWKAADEIIRAMQAAQKASLLDQQAFDISFQSRIGVCGTLTPGTLTITQMYNHAATTFALQNIGGGGAAHQIAGKENNTKAEWFQITLDALARSNFALPEMGGFLVGPDTMRRLMEYKNSAVARNQGASRLLQRGGLFSVCESVEITLASMLRLENDWIADRLFVEETPVDSLGNALREKSEDEEAMKCYGRVKVTPIATAQRIAESNKKSSSNPNVFANKTVAELFLTRDAFTDSNSLTTINDDEDGERQQQVPASVEGQDNALSSNIEGELGAARTWSEAEDEELLQFAPELNFKWDVVACCFVEGWERTPEDVRLRYATLRQKRTV